MLWTTSSSGENGFWRDPLGWEGPRSERPWVYDRLIAAKRREDSIDLTVRMHCRLDPVSGAFTAPHYPPSPRCYEHPSLLTLWKRWQEVLDAMSRDQTRKDEWYELAELEQRWVVTRDGRKVGLSPSGDDDRRVWIYWDPVGDGTLIGVDRYGSIARQIDDPGELSEAI